MPVAFTPRRRASLFAHIQISRFFLSGDWFRSADLAPMLDLPSRSVGILLRDLAEEGVLQREIRAGSNTFYRRPRKPLASISWRIDESVYELIEDL